MLGRQLQQDVTRVSIYSSQGEAEREVPHATNDSKQSSPVTSALSRSTKEKDGRGVRGQMLY